MIANVVGFYINMKKYRIRKMLNEEFLCQMNNQVKILKFI